MSIRNLFIASEVRSGSTFIAESLAYSFSNSYGVDFWNLSMEFFNSLSNGSGPADIYKILGGIGANQKGMRCAKLMCGALSIISRETKENESLRNFFFGESTCWIIIRRRNKIKQAVSLATALSSRNWHYYANPENAPDRSVALANIDIFKSLGMINFSDDYLENFSRLTARCSTVFYEDFVGNEEFHLKRIIDELRLPFSTTILSLSPVKIQKTAVDLKINYEAEFRAYFKENYHYVVNDVGGNAEVDLESNAESGVESVMVGDPVAEKLNAIRTAKLLIDQFSLTVDDLGLHRLQGGG
jgi:hypothetical protein